MAVISRKIVGADSGCAELNSELTPINIIASTAVYVEYPYRMPLDILCNIEPFNAESSEYIFRELDIARKLAEKWKPDQIHIDISLGGIGLEDLTEEYLESTRISKRGREHLIPLLKDIRETAKLIEKETGAKIIFIGKESRIVRLAELSTVICAVKYALTKVSRGKEVLIGLPKRCSMEISGKFIIVRSHFHDEGDMIVYQKMRIPENLRIIEFPNPNANGFIVLKIFQI